MVSSIPLTRVVPKPSERVHFGRGAEQLVADFMVDQGLIILARNQRVGPDELDIVARDGSTLVVCEVRSSSNDRFYDPIETIGPKKIACIRRGTARWLAVHRPHTRGLRFDAASVVFGADSTRITYYEEAF